MEAQSVLFRTKGDRRIEKTGEGVPAGGQRRLRTLQLDEFRVDRFADQVFRSADGVERHLQHRMQET